MPGQVWAYDSYSKADGMNGLNRGQYRDYLEEAQISTPSLSIVFVEETDPRGYNHGTWFLSFNPPGWVIPLRSFTATGARLALLTGMRKGISGSILAQSKPR